MYESGWAEQVKPVSDSESDEEGEGCGEDVESQDVPAVALGFSEASLAEAFEAKQHLTYEAVQGRDNDDGAGGASDGAPAEAEGGGCETVVPGAYGTAPGEGSERFSAMAAAEAAKFKKERSAHYNEYEKMQEYKRKLAAGELTDEDY